MYFGRPIRIDWEKIHTCEKSTGRIIMIGTDGSGRTFCGYCGQMVNYDQEIKEQEDNEVNLEISRLKCPFCQSELLSNIKDNRFLCNNGHEFTVPRIILE